jgi:hypothetical protein
MCLPKIPDEIYENRCRYCGHFLKDGENREIKSHEIWLPESRFPGPCKIQAIAKYKYQIRNNGLYEYLTYEDGECRSFTPKFGYPMCEYCEHHNHFHEDTYCLKETPFDQRRVVALGNTYGREVYKVGFMICDCWKLRSTVRDTALKYIADGKLPKLMNPETFMLLKPVEENEAAEKWLKIEADRKEELKRKTEEEKARKEKEELDRMTDRKGQLKLF